MCVLSMFSYWQKVDLSLFAKRHLTGQKDLPRINDLQDRLRKV